ncbi:DUF5994 family protein [Mycolicibacterium holsaticum]|uniref:DUF5994 family protein n=1 Tax=Mycolicibacterium holsaticum TaxID=152142 RepID=UPI000848D603|nr:DUF5994 family protein [Mycolicibacterium holsaticum]
MALCDRGTQTGGVDGLWWPTCTDLRKVLPDLVTVLSRLIGTVHRVVYDPTVWPHAPSRIIRGNTQVSVDPYALVAPETIYLMGTHSRDAVLYVVAPSSRKDVVGRLFRAVADANGPMSADMLRQLTDDISNVAPGVDTVNSLQEER